MKILVQLVLSFLLKPTCSRKSYPLTHPFKTLWPLQEGFVSLSIHNLNFYVQQFSGCLIHIYNYQGIEILGLQEPVLLTRFDVFGYWGNISYNNDVYYSFYEKSPSMDEVLRHQPMYKEERRKAKAKEWTLAHELYVLDKSSKAKWNCQASFDLFFPEHANFHYLHENYGLRMQSVIFGSMMKFTNVKPKKSLWIMDIRPTFHILVSLPNTSIDTQLLWEIITTQSALNLRTNVQLIFITSEISIKIPNLGSNEVYIASLTRICKICNGIHPAYIHIPKDNITSMRLIENEVPTTWSMYSTKFAYTKKLTNYNPSKRRYPFLHTLDRAFELLSCVVTNASLTHYDGNRVYGRFPNTTLWLKEHLLAKRVPSLRTKTNILVPALLHTRKVYTFLICSMPLAEAISISSLLSVYELKIWILIIAFILIWPVLISFIENNFSYREVMKDTDAFFLGIMILLEQSHIRTVNKLKKGSLYIFCGCAILVCIVLSNAFKGENITKISSSLKPIQFTTFDQLMERGYDIYYPEQAGIWFAKEGKPPSVSSAKLEKILEYAQEWEYTQEEREATPEDFWTTNITIFDPQIRLFSECRRQAYLDWNFALENLHQSLKKIKRDYFYMGEDYLFYEDEGWYFRDYHSNKIVLRVARLHSTGIPGFWRQFQKNPIPKEIFRPKKLEVNSHLMSIFIMLAGGCLLSGVSFITENILNCKLLNLHDAVLKCHRVLITFIRVFERGFKRIIRLTV